MKFAITATRIGLSLFASCLVLISGQAQAATPAPAATVAPTPSSGQALEIAPPVINLSGNPGQTITAQISLRDISNTNLVVTGQVNDFIAAGEDGTPKIILDNTETPYSLKSWIGTLPTLNMIPRQIKTLPVSITIPTNAAPGGHYGVVRFTARPPELSGTGVSLAASLGSLILVNVNGNVKESMSVEQFTVSQNGKDGSLFQKTPLNFTERLRNTGNTHEQPTGQVVITDMFGKKVAALNVNTPPRNVLPASIRKFEQPLDSTVIGDKRLFGKYTASMNVSFGANKQATTAKLTFWVIPYRLIGIIVLVLVGGFFALRFLLGRYNRSIINRSRGGRGRRR